MVAQNGPNGNYPENGKRREAPLARLLSIPETVGGAGQPGRPTADRGPQAVGASPTLDTPALDQVRQVLFQDLEAHRELVSPHRPAVVQIEGVGTIHGTARLLSNGWVEVFDDTGPEPPVQRREQYEQEHEDKCYQAALERWHETACYSYPAHRVRCVRWLRPSSEEPCEYGDPFADYDGRGEVLS